MPVPWSIWVKQQNNSWYTPENQYGPPENGALEEEIPNLDTIMASGSGR